VPSADDSPRVPLLMKKMCCGDPAPNNQPSARRSSARSTAPSGVGMQSPDEAATKGGVPENHRRTLTSRIVLTREKAHLRRE
jgi:hypothetical protein